jgi:aspartate ammonia-lyase
MRKESDFLGEVDVPDDAYYGSFTSRAKENFKLSNTKVHDSLIKAVILIKKCAAAANMELEMLDKAVANAIIQAADEALDGKFDSEFVLDAFQAGAGTPLHMNVNEVLANRAEEILGGKKGEYLIVHPNNHVNMAQSSNNVIPSAMRIASISLASSMINSAKNLSNSLWKKSKEYRDSMKIGRTHLQDAVPMSFGQTFGAYAVAIDKDILEMEIAVNGMRNLGIGGTATGSGITAHPEFRKTITKELRKTVDVQMAEDPVEMTVNMNDMVSFASSMKRYAITLDRIANDLRLYSSGPKAGIAEILLPEVEPGSSIMPGKVNPSVPEAQNMVSLQVIANAHAVDLAAQSGQLELNFMAPLAAHNILESVGLLRNSADMFGKCISGLKVNIRTASENLDKTFGYATALNPYLGYKEVSLLIAEADQKNMDLKELIVEKGLMEKEDVEKIIKTATGPSVIDKRIKQKI